MIKLTKSILIFAILGSVSVIAVEARADDEDSKTTIIQNYDLSEDQAPPSGPNYALLVLELQKLKAPNANGHLIFRQLNKRVRLEVTGNSFPKGKYSIGILGNCGTTKGWTMVHSVTVDSAYVASEKSLPKYALRRAGAGETLLEGKNAGLFRHQGKNLTLIACQPIK